MKESYLQNYLKTYLWHGLAVILNITSMFIVIPIITDNKIIYGIYSICISAAMFLNYADLGFVKAGLKYAGESFARGDTKTEIKYYGFSSFILFAFVLIFASIYFFLAYNPSLLIKDVFDKNSIEIASSLLFIQALFSFNTVFQRFVSGFCEVRIEQYIYQRINIVGSALNILSAFYFFGNGEYDIVGYFLFMKLVELISSFICIYILKRRYELSIILLIKSFRFDSDIYNRVKGLAYSSLFATIMWVLFYELDIIAIGSFFGAASAAVFALAFTFMKFLRSLTGIIFSPFMNRFNHLVGLKNIIGLKSLLTKLILFTLPIFVFIVVSIFWLSENIIICWVGDLYIDASVVLMFLILGFVFSPITIPGAGILVSLERVKEIYIVNSILVILFWFGIFLTKDYYGFFAFPKFKLVASIISAFYYLRFILNFLELKVLDFIKIMIFPLIIPVIIQFSFLYITRNLLPSTEGMLNLFLIIINGGFSILLGCGALFISSSYYKIELKHIFKSI